jgi:glutathione peroxidase
MLKLALFTLAAFLVVQAVSSRAVADDKAVSKATGVHAFKMDDINGAPVDLSKYKGKVLLVVNVASKCGMTPQYANLEKLNQQYKGKGLAILGFPANEFGKQEPGSNIEIKEFCTSKYDVTFDMFSKSVVKGEGISPLYSYLTGPDANPKTAGEIKWNFTKFLVGKDGKVVARFEPKVKPDDKQVIEAIEAELAK